MSISFHIDIGLSFHISKFLKDWLTNSDYMIENLLNTKYRNSAVIIIYKHITDERPCLYWSNMLGTYAWATEMTLKYLALMEI